MTAQNYQIRLANQEDTAGLLYLRHAAINSINCSDYQQEQVRKWASADVKYKYHHFLQTNCLWVIGPPQKPLASTGISLANQCLIAVFTKPEYTGKGFSRKLIQYAEQQACRFGITQLFCEASLNAVKFYQNLGYKISTESNQCDQLAIPCCKMKKSLTRKHTVHQQEVLRNLAKLGIPANYGVLHALPIQSLPGKLVDAGLDCFQRPLKLTEDTLHAWKKMQAAANSDKVSLMVVSGFRSIDYQTKIIEAKLSKGQTIETILKASAAPGFSEHHTGYAIDLNTTNCPPLEEAFADTNAYQWLIENAMRYNFYQSYPQDNSHQITWEPWHWCFKAKR